MSSQQPITFDQFYKDITTSVNTYMMNTHNMNDYNEIYNVNNYLDEKTTLEKQRLQHIYDRLNSHLLGIKQEYLLRRFDINHYKSKINILLSALFLVCILLILVILFTDDKIGHKLLLVVIVVTVVFFSFIVYLISSSNTYREKTNWDMYYWGPVKKGAKK